MSITTVRGATGDDLARVAEIWVRSWQAAYADIVPADYLAELDPHARHDTLLERAADPSNPTETIVAEEQSRVVGFTVVGPWRGPDAERRLGELLAIYLDPRHCRRGIGRRLIAHAEQRLRERGYAEVRLWVLEANAPARRFYRSVGWMPDGIRQTYEVGGAELPELRYARRLLADG